MIICKLFVCIVPRCESQRQEFRIRRSPYGDTKTHDSKNRRAKKMFTITESSIPPLALKVKPNCTFLHGLCVCARTRAHVPSDNILFVGKSDFKSRPERIQFTSALECGTRRIYTLRDTTRQLNLKFMLLFLQRSYRIPCVYVWWTSRKFYIR